MALRYAMYLLLHFCQVLSSRKLPLQFWLVPYYLIKDVLYGIIIRRLHFAFMFYFVPYCFSRVFTNKFKLKFVFQLAETMYQPNIQHFNWLKQFPFLLYIIFQPLFMRLLFVFSFFQSITKLYKNSMPKDLNFGFSFWKIGRYILLHELVNCYA